MKVKDYLANGALMASVLVASVFVGEMVARWVLNPADYLSVELVPDSVLGAVPSVSTAGGGLDEWGFRNPHIPPSVDIVAIGDSHTFGNTATMDESWPHVLSRLSGLSVYSMALGGYGPNQYFHLLKTKALKLRPRTIIVGLYMGDDFENAFLITYGLDYWANLRALSPEKVDFDVWKFDQSVPAWHKRVRIWLSRHSVIYQLVFHGPVLGRLQGQLQIQNAPLFDGAATSLAIPEEKILEAFRPTPILRNLDQQSENVREGMRITFNLIGEMNELCHNNSIRFVVAVIPTKEMVFAEYFARKTDIPLHGTIETLLRNEQIARNRTFQFLNDSNIPHVDVLPYLRRFSGEELYARTAADMHPNGNGYKVIAQAIFDALHEAK